MQLCSAYLTFYIAQKHCLPRCLHVLRLRRCKNSLFSRQSPVLTAFQSIRESRILAPKYSELKLQGLFYHASPSLLVSSIINSGAGAPFTSNSGVFTTHLGGGNATPTNYYVLRQMSNK